MHTLQSSVRYLHTRDVKWLELALAAIPDWTLHIRASAEIEGNSLVSTSGIRFARRALDQGDYSRGAIDEGR